MQWLKPQKYKTKAAHPEPVGEPKINLIYSLGVAPSSSPWAWPTFMDLLIHQLHEDDSFTHTSLK